MTFKLSICIPTLNRGSCIGETLASITSQLEKNVEVVIVDGGSTDNTEQVVSTFQSNFPNIKYVKKQASKIFPSNEGFDRDCNHSVELAAGEYCWLMTDDDIFMPGSIKKVLQEIEKNYALILASVEIRNLDLSEELVACRPNIKVDAIYEPKDWNKFAAEVGGHLTFVGAVIIKRSLWINRQPEKYFGSGFVHIGVIFHEVINQKIILIAEPLISIRYGNAHWSSRAFQILMFNWPEMIWSISTISEQAKKAISPKEPWKKLTTLLVQRVYGRYSIVEYKAFITPSEITKLRKLFAKIIAVFPRFILLMPAYLYAWAKFPKNKFILFNLNNSWF